MSRLEFDYEKWVYLPSVKHTVYSPVSEITSCVEIEAQFVPFSSFSDMSLSSRKWSDLGNREAPYVILRKASNNNKAWGI